MAIAATTLIAALASPAAQAQVNPLESTGGFKSACENNPGNIVVINTDMTVKIGYPAGYPEQVATGCRIELLNDASIQFDKVGLQFAGPLVIVGGAKAGLDFQDASLAGTSVDIRFTGVEGSLQMKFSRIDATAGDLAIALGSTAKLELLNGRTGGAPLTRATLAATGALSISALNKFTASLNEVGLVAGGNLAVSGNGTESELKLENAGVVSFGGAVAIGMFAEKSRLDFGNSSLRSAGNLDVFAGRSESGIGLSNVTLTSAGRVQIYAAGAKSDVAMSNGTISAGAGVLLSAAAGSSEGKLEIGNFAVSAATPIRMITGVQGSTIVKDSRFTGTGLVQAASDPATGKCESVNNRVTAPQAQLCF